MKADSAVVWRGPQKVASLHIQLNLDVETDRVWVVILELEDSSEVKFTVQTRCLQSSQGAGRDSIGIELGMSSTGWYQAHETC